jgi:hypothetical protein
LEEAGSDPAALAVAGPSLEELSRAGSSPEEAMGRFEEWVAGACGRAKPVFVGLNAALNNVGFIQRLVRQQLFAGSSMEPYLLRILILRPILLPAPHLVEQVLPFLSATSS